MRSILTARNIVFALSATVIAGLALSGVAHAISSAAFRYSTPKTAYLMFPVAAFMPLTSGGWTGSGDTIAATSQVCFYAPVNLPQGARLTQLIGWYAAVAPHLSGILDIDRTSPSEMVRTLIGEAKLDGSKNTAAVSIADASLQTVDNGHYGYYLYLCLDRYSEFRGARIKYTYTTAGD
jgi:hypothetical protein